MYAVSNKDENVHRFTVRGGTSKTFERERDWDWDWERDREIEIEREREILRERMSERERY